MKRLSCALPAVLFVLAASLAMAQGPALQPAIRSAMRFDAPPKPEAVPAEPGEVKAPDSEAPSWTLEDLHQIALSRNPALARAEALLEAAHGQWLQAGLPPNPVVGYSGQQLGSSGAAEQQGVLIGQRVILGQKLQLDRAVAEQQIQRAEQFWAAQRQRVLTDVANGYYNVLIAQQRVELALELDKVSKQALATAEARKKAEVGTQSEVYQAQIESQATGILLGQSRDNLLFAWRGLAAVLGVPQQAPRTLEGSLQETVPDLNWNDSLQRLLSESPQVAAAAARLEQARWTVQREYAEVIPDIDVEGVIQHDNSTGSSNGNLQVTLPLPIWNRNQGGIHRAENRLAAARREVRRVELELQYRLADVFRRYQNARRQAEGYETQIVPSAKQNFDLVSRLYQAGEINYLNLLTAQRTYFQTKMKHFEAIRDMRRAANEIEGLLLSGSLQER